MEELLQVPARPRSCVLAVVFLVAVTIGLIVVTLMALSGIVDLVPEFDV